MPLSKPTEVDILSERDILSYHSPLHANTSIIQQIFPRMIMIIENVEEYVVGQNLITWTSFVIVIIMIIIIIIIAIILIIITVIVAIVCTLSRLRSGYKQNKTVHPIIHTIETERWISKEDRIGSRSILR